MNTLSSLVIRLVSLSLVFQLIVSSCDVTGKLEVAKATLDAAQHAIDILATQPGQWRAVLDDFSNQLKQDLSELAQDVLHDVDLLAKDTIAAAGTQVHCLIDRLGTHVRDYLLQFQAKLRKEPLPAVPPGVCQINPDHIELKSENEHLLSKDPIIKITGYNFEPSHLPVVQLVDGGIVRSKYENRISYVTRYELTLDVQQLDFNVATPLTRLVLKWDDGAASNALTLVFPQLPHEPSWVTIIDQNTNVAFSGADTNTAIDILPLDRLEISCTGNSERGPYFGQWVPFAGPEGKQINPSEEPNPLPSAWTGSVIGRIGSAGSYFLIARSYDDTYNSAENVPKRFFLRTNVAPSYANQWRGTFTCHVAVRRFQ